MLSFFDETSYISPKENISNKRISRCMDIFNMSAQKKGEKFNESTIHKRGQVINFKNNRRNRPSFL